MALRRDMMPYLLLAFAGCGDGKDQDTADAGTPAPEFCPPDSEVTWENFTQGFVTTWCTGCHTETLAGEARKGAPVGVDFDTYEDVVAHGALIRWQATGDPPQMPPAGGTSHEARLLLLEWIDCGMKAEAPSTPECGGAPSVGDVTLASQADADALCASFDAVEGSVTVTGGAVTVDCLCEISGDLTIQGNATEVSFPQLANVQGALTVRDNPSLSRLDLPALVAVGVEEDLPYGATSTGPDAANGGVTLEDNPALSEILLPWLIDVGGDLSVLGTSAERVDLHELETVLGALVVEDNADLEEFEVTRLREVVGDVRFVDNPALASIASTLAIEIVGGDVVIVGNDALDELDALGTVESLGGDVEIAFNAGLTRVVGFTLVESLPGSVSIHDNPKLVRVDGFDNLADLAGDLTVTNNAGLFQVGGFGQLVTLGGVLTLASNPTAFDFVGFDELESAAGLVLADNVSAPGLSDFPKLLTVTGDVALTGLRDLATFDGLILLHEIGGDLVLADNDLLGAIDGLGSLEIVGGSLRLDANASLTSLGTLEGLQSVGGSLEITDNATLPSVAELSTVGSVGGDLVVTGNLALPSADAQALADAIGAENIGGATTISGNAP